MGKITNANQQDAKRLCEVAVSAFLEDEQHKPDYVPKGGPPDHDNEQTHIDWIRRDIYLKYEADGRICGGCVARINGSQGKVVGIFVEASSMNRGVGSSLLRHLIQKYPKVKTWNLETPDYSTRNHAFYEKHGFVCIEHSKPEPDIGFGFYRYFRVS